MKIVLNVGTLKVCYSERPHTCHLDPAVTTFALSQAHISIHPSRDPHFVMHFRVNRRHPCSSPYYFITNVVIFEETQRLRILCP